MKTHSFSGYISIKNIMVLYKRMKLSRTKIAKLLKMGNQSRKNKGIRSGTDIRSGTSIRSKSLVDLKHKNLVLGDDDGLFVPRKRARSVHKRKAVNLRLKSLKHWRGRGGVSQWVEELKKLPDDTDEEKVDKFIAIAKALNNIPSLISKEKPKVAALIERYKRGLESNFKKNMLTGLINKKFSGNVISTHVTDALTDFPNDIDAAIKEAPEIENLSKMQDIRKSLLAAIASTNIEKQLDDPDKLKKYEELE